MCYLCCAAFRHTSVVLALTTDMDNDVTAGV